jgi:hypothetical protein
MPLVEPQEFKLDHGVTITCAQPIDSDRLAELINGFLQEIAEPEAENSVTQPFTKPSRETPSDDIAPGQGWVND